jgi:1-deoxy-D-xylulose-5-phosphate reductoisomerase
MRLVTVLGASGSIGKSSIEFLRLHRAEFALCNVAFKSDWQTALTLCAEFNCRAVSFADPTAAETFAIHCSQTDIRVLSGTEGTVELASDPVDVVLAAISGSSGLAPVLAAVRAGNRVALANKEALVCGGPALLDLARSKGVTIVPVDSEHSALYQCLFGGKREEVESLVLTASGGPFRTSTLAEMRSATREQALNHPNWSMGVKNTIDSATLANKGLELIEAAYLFECDESDIEVVINPSSVLHSAVAFKDGSMLAQLGHPDMRVAIGYGLSWPDRLMTGVARLSLSKLRRLDFEEVDLEKFRCLSLARSALRIAGDGPMLFNAANEVAVAAFMDGGIGLLDIAGLVEECLERGAGRFVGTLDDAPELAAEAMRFCRSESKLVRASV